MSVNYEQLIAQRFFCTFCKRVGMVDERTQKFLDSLKVQLGQRDIHEEEIAGWLGISTASVSRRLNGIIPFQREEIEILDQELEEHGALLWEARYVPEGYHPPVGIYLNEEWLQQQIEYAEVIARFDRLDRAEQHITQLRTELAPFKEESLGKKYRMKLRLELLDIEAYRPGRIQAVLQKATKLEKAIQAIGDRQLLYDYYTLMSDFANGANDYELALAHERQALKLVDSLEKPTAARLETEISLVNLLAFSAPSSSEPEQYLETVRSALYVPSYDLGKWPKLNEPNYLDVLQAEFNLRLEQGGHTSEAGDILTTILEKFLDCPYKTQKTTSLLCAAEFYAIDKQQSLMENYLKQAQSLIEGEEIHWFDSEIERITEMAKDGEA
jgi:hypothetical protein